MGWLKQTVRIVIGALSLSAATALAGNVPNTLNYQGTLTDSTGKPVTAAAKSVTFKMYTSALGGTAFWTEPQSVPVTDGQFSAVLGNTVPLPPDKFTGNTFIGITVENGPEMLPRQKLTSVAYALKAADAIPKGVIVMWSGLVNQVPEGWALCDGTNGTPNLQDRFVVGAGTRFGPGKVRGITGGEEEHTLTLGEMPTHSHTQSAHTHIQDAHAHSIPADGGTSDSGGPYMRFDSGYTGHASTSSATGTNQYSTGVIHNSGGDAPHNNLPPYYTLAFIVKM